MTNNTTTTQKNNMDIVIKNLMVKHYSNNKRATKKEFIALRDKYNNERITTEQRLYNINRAIGDLNYLINTYKEGLK